MKKKEDTFSELSELQQDMIRTDVERLAYDHILAENKRYVTLKAWAGQIPNALHEIGRLRELAFREVGKGTGRKVDIDQFDLYYMHILIWSKERREIVGSCRIGQVDIVLKRYGREGLYAGRLSTFLPAFVRHETNTLEISKAFVRKEYQRQVEPVSLLCRGIGKFIAHNPHYRGLIGFVSHRGSIQDISKMFKTHRSSRKMADLPVHSCGKMPNLLRMGGTIGENSVLAFVNLTESWYGLRYFMSKTALERFTEYHQQRQDRAA